MDLQGMNRPFRPFKNKIKQDDLFKVLVQDSAEIRRVS